MTNLQYQENERGQYVYLSLSFPVYFLNSCHFNSLILFRYSAEADKWQDEVERLETELAQSRANREELLAQLKSSRSHLFSILTYSPRFHLSLSLSLSIYIYIYICILFFIFIYLFIFFSSKLAQSEEALKQLQLVFCLFHFCKHATISI